MEAVSHDDMVQLEEAARKASDMLKALANEYRLLILCHLLDGEKQVAELQTLFNLSQSSLSQHLARLRHEGLVNTRRESQAIFYSLAGDEAKEILKVLYTLYCEPQTKSQPAATKENANAQGVKKVAGF